MKKLLLIIVLLTGIACYGQERFMIEKVDTTSCDSIDADRFILVFSTFLEYQKYCYNDSTKVGIQWDFIEYDSLKHADIYQTTDIYEHRNNPSFTGFIEWVKKKYKIIPHKVDSITFKDR